jgi:hypothetical protein
MSEEPLTTKSPEVRLYAAYMYGDADLEACLETIKNNGSLYDRFRCIAIEHERIVLESNNSLREAVKGLRAARAAYFEGSPHDGTEKSPEGYLYAAIDRVLGEVT